MNKAVVAILFCLMVGLNGLAFAHGGENNGGGNKNKQYFQD